MESIRIFHRGLSGDVVVVFQASSTKIQMEHTDETRIGSLMLIMLQDMQEKSTKRRIESSVLFLTPNTKTNVCVFCVKSRCWSTRS